LWVDIEPLWNLGQGKAYFLECFCRESCSFDFAKIAKVDNSMVVLGLPLLHIKCLMQTLLICLFEFFDLMVPDLATFLCVDDAFLNELVRVELVDSLPLSDSLIHHGLGEPRIHI
jgi:hypothetical protein